MVDKILLIRPENLYHYNNYPPLNLISLASKLRADGYDVKIINCALEKDSLAYISRELENAVLVGITLLTSEIPDAYRIIKHIKTRSDVPVAVGGWHCTLFPEQMADFKYVDYVIAGEGEEHFSRLLRMIKEKKTISDRIFPKEILDLDKLPVPDYSLDDRIEGFITNFLTDKLSEYVKYPMRWLPYESSRGCPSQCTFCINVVSNNNRYRKKSAEKVVEEIEHITKKYGLTHLKIIDDNFFVDIRRDREICQGLIKRKINITWDAETRCDYFNDTMLNDETLTMAKRSGLVQLSLGIESGSNHTLEIMKKGITPEQGEFAVKKCNDFGIVARSSFIIEIPGENFEDIRKTIAFVKRLRKYPYFTCGVQNFRPYPRCELTEKLIKEGKLHQPKNFEKWLDNEIINIYVSAQYVRPWQINGKYSETVAYYLTMESGVSLSKHQLDRMTDRFLYSLFILLAKIRNKIGFYKWPIDKRMYQKFFASFYNRRQELERSFY
jgi:anaerobic magnesium-protoporphyrin IX monomethyl ester cyclase